MEKRKFTPFNRKMWKLSNIPLFYKLSICFLFLSFLMILLSYGHFMNYKKDKEAVSLEAIDLANKQTMGRIDSYLADLSSITIIPLMEQNSKDNFFQNLKSFQNNQVSLDFQREADMIFNKMFLFKKDIHSIFLFNLNGMSEYKVLDTALLRPFDPVREVWFRKSIESFGRPQIVSTYHLPNVSDQRTRPIQVFGVARGLVDVNAGAVAAVLLVNTKVDYLAEQIKNLMLFPNQRVVIVDKNGQTIYDTHSPNIGSPADMNLQNIAKARLSQASNIDGTHSIVRSFTSEVNEWTILTIIPERELFRQINQAGKVTMFFTFLAIAGSFFFLFIISRQIVNPIRTLINTIKKFEKGNFGVKVQDNRADEIGALGSSFNRMTDRIQDLIQEVYIDKLRKKELQLQSLQNQINPHFLYNTIESIRMMAEINDDDEASRMAVALGGILRYGITDPLSKVQLRDEIHYLKEYVLLQQVRYGDLFQIVIHVEEEIEDVPIPKMVLQPLVENAINHGLKYTSDGGLITISVRKLENHVVFEVTDNGGGFSVDKLKQTMDDLNGMNESPGSIGMKNVHQRIGLHYGVGYGLQIRSVEKVQTTVFFQIPIMT
ncbi:sensor histidine kinase [Paenibacillus qinlingensis]|uniref:Two-component system sensor histidine kinase YesM n=1 Tax=Paenibacillus qinlingensis TaxID=1837343 RepID=A0ABU1NXM9_9BACL|nr:sensor histidine kinase [Paenibacillus qinlingensis]MDR6552255.1 two-component system sensor histidine kinase YesM [Paenibacillus qinlingensis]